MTVEMVINVTSSRYLHWESHLVHFFGFEIGSSNGMSDGNGNFKLEGSPLGEQSFGSEARTKVGYFVGSSYRKVSYYVDTSVDHGDGSFEGSPLGDALDTGYITEGGSSDGSSYVGVY